MPERLSQRVLLVGWDACDWKIARPLMDAGLMPTLKGLVDRGVWGNLATIQPILSPILWNSIATGKRPHKHGIFGFTESSPDGEGVRLATSTSRKCLALWNILHKAGMRTNVVGWYASHPAEPINGVMVTNQFEQPTGVDPNDWPLPGQCVHPEALRDELAPMRVHPQEIGAAAVLPFVPKAAGATEAQQQKLQKLRVMMAQTVSVHAAATHLLTTQPADLTMVYYEGIDRFGHEFMEHYPPRMDHISQADFEMFQGVMTGIYRFHDMMLDTLLKLAGEETTVILMSDHGYQNDHLRPGPDANPVAWHRPIGVVAMAGPGIKKGDRIYGGTILDAAPTVLRLLGLSHAADMDGRPWLEAFENRRVELPIPTWETEGATPAETGRHAAELYEDPEANRQAILQLVALGYMQAIPEDKTAAADRCVIDNRTQEIASLIDAGLVAQAEPLLEGLIEDPVYGEGCRIQLAVCRMMRGNVDGARAVVQKLVNAENAPARVWVILASLAAMERKPEEAERHLIEARRRGGDEADILLRLGNLQLSRQRWREAIELFEQVLAMDPDSASVHDGLAQAHLGCHQYEPALDHSLRAIELAHNLPRAHFNLGRVLVATGQPERATDAFKVCLSMNPVHLGAHEALEKLYLQAGNAALALRHRNDASKIREFRSAAGTDQD